MIPWELHFLRTKLMSFPSVSEKNSSLVFLEMHEIHICWKHWLMKANQSKSCKMNASWRNINMKTKKPKVRKATIHIEVVSHLTFVTCCQADRRQLLIMQLIKGRWNKRALSSCAEMFCLTIQVFEFGLLSSLQPQLQQCFWLLFPCHILKEMCVTLSVVFQRIILTIVILCVKRRREKNETCLWVTLHGFMFHRNMKPPWRLSNWNVKMHTKLICHKQLKIVLTEVADCMCSLMWLRKHASHKRFLWCSRFRTSCPCIPIAFWNEGMWHSNAIANQKLRLSMRLNPLGRAQCVVSLSLDPMMPLRHSLVCF